MESITISDTEYFMEDKEVKEKLESIFVMLKMLGYSVSYMGGRSSLSIFFTLDTRIQISLICDREKIIHIIGTTVTCCKNYEVILDETLYIRNNKNCIDKLMKYI